MESILFIPTVGVDRLPRFIARECFVRHNLTMLIAYKSIHQGPDDIYSITGFSDYPRFTSFHYRVQVRNDKVQLLYLTGAFIGLCVHLITKMCKIVFQHVDITSLSRAITL